MESIIITNVLVIIFYFLVSSLMMPVSKCLKLPFTVFLALLGIVFGSLILLLDDMVFHVDILHDIISGAESFSFSPEVVLFIFLPAILFESALDLDVRKLLSQIKPILFLAIIGLLISTFIIAFGMYSLINISLLGCLLIGVISSATDPIAVVALFKEVGAPKKLATLVEGESLFNDATAIVLYMVLTQMLLSPVDQSWWSPLLSFLKVFFGGAFVGILLSYLTCALVRVCSGFSTAQVNLTIVLAYGSFMIAEHYFHVSGVMAVIFSAFTMSLLGRTSFTGSTWQSMVSLWHRFSFWSNTLIFLLMGLLFVDMLISMTGYDILLACLFIVLAHLARFLVVFVILPLMAKIGVMKSISFSYRSVMFWGGLRGTISLALVLLLIDNPAMPDDLKSYSAILVGSLVLFTLFVNATTVAPLMRYFGLDRLSPAETLLRNRVLKMAYHSIKSDGNISDDIVMKREVQLGELLGVSDDVSTSFTEKQWEDLAFNILILQEKSEYLSLHEKGIISSDIAQYLVFYCDSMLDHVEDDGYLNSSDQLLSFSWQFLLARSIYQYLNRPGYIMCLLQTRLARLNIVYDVLSNLKDKQLTQVMECVDQKIHQQLFQKIDERMERVQIHLNAIASQYPEYSKEWNSQILSRKTLQLELAEFSRLRDKSLITEGIYGNVIDTLEHESESLHQKLVLDLHQSPAELIQKVPFLAKLPSEAIDAILKFAKPCLFFPKEFIFHKGDIGQSMFFVSNGSVEVLLDNQKIVLGSGSFFGELAILNNAPRVASVRTISYCDLLEISQSDFLELMKNNPDLWAKVKAEVDRRQS